MTRVAPIRRARRVKRLGLRFVAARIRAGCILSEVARMRLVTRRARRVTFRRRRRLLRMARRAARLLRRLVGCAVTALAVGVTRPRSDRLLHRTMTIPTERGAGDLELVLLVTASARHVSCMERGLVLRLLVARRARGRDRGAGFRVRRMASDAMTGIALRLRVLRLELLVTARACERGRLLRFVRIVAARACRVLLHLRRGERLHVRMTRRARGLRLRRSMRCMTRRACGVALRVLRRVRTVRMTTDAALHVGLRRAMRLVARGARGVSSDVPSTRRDHRPSDTRKSGMRRIAWLDVTTLAGIRCDGRFRVRRVTRGACLSRERMGGIDRRSQRRARIAFEPRGRGVGPGIDRRHCDVERDVWIFRGDRHSSVRRRSALMAARAICKDRPLVLFRVRVMARRAGDVLVRVMGEGRLAHSVLLRVGMACGARLRALAGAEDVTRLTRRRLLHAALVRLRCLLFVTAAACVLDDRPAIEAARVALGAGDLLFADVRRMHRGRARVLPRLRHVLRWRRRIRAQADRPNRDRDRSDDAHEEHCDEASALHGMWHIRQGTSRVLSSALVKPRP